MHVLDSYHIDTGKGKKWYFKTLNINNTLNNNAITLDYFTLIALTDWKFFKMGDTKYYNRDFRSMYWEEFSNMFNGCYNKHYGSK